MVVRTPSLNSLKKGSFLPQIHHPLPLGRRESKKLYDSITSSFRKNLDEAHPWQAEENHSEASVVQASPLRPKPRPTDRHLHAILSNPLFNHGQYETQQSLQGAMAKHFDVFNAAESKGMMNVRRAAGFLTAIRKEISQSSITDTRQGMGVSGAGLRVVQWLRAAGLENDLRFLDDQTFTKILVQFMTAEGLEEVAWTWLERIAYASEQSASGPLSGIQPFHAARLLFLLVTNHKPEAPPPGSASSLDKEYSALLRAKEMLPTSSALTTPGLQGTWTHLSYASTSSESSRPKPSAPLFERFVDVGRPWDRQVDIAHLDLYHPTSPDHEAAVRYLHDETRVKSDFESAAALSKKRSPRVLSLAVDTVARLKEAGQEDEASWVMQFLKRTYENWKPGSTLIPWRATQTKDGPILDLKGMRGSSGNSFQGA